LSNNKHIGGDRVSRRHVLLQWIGHSDLRALAASLPATQRDEIMQRVKGELPEKENVGPIKTLLQTQSFDEVRLLSNYPTAWNKKFAEWLEVKVVVVAADLKKPTDYKSIFQIADAELAAIRERKDWDSTELCLHLSPGTPAMAAVWLLLGKTRYPATFYETFGGKSWVTEIPFDLTIDVLPDLFKNPDTYLQHLASESPSEIEGFTDIVGDSTAIRDAVGRAKRAAIRGVAVLLLGESGTGKEMFAQAIHKASPRREKPFLAINCAALSKTLLESELFGHTRGSFTGAERERKGAFELVDGGSIFLDEIGECDLETQANLLRVLQPLPGEGPSIRTIRRLGDDKDRKVDVRVIAATNRDLHTGIRDGIFREDLYYRLAAITITLPPLRDRKADIPRIAEKLLDQINRQFKAEEPNYADKSFSGSAIAFMKRHGWPGNVRQLFNVLVQAAVMSNKNTLERGDLVAALGEMPDDNRGLTAILNRPIGDEFNLEEYLNDIQHSYLRRAMEEAKGVKTQAARLLGMKNYQTLDAQLKRLGVAGEWQT
jgi:DNA-binding NtrC family response regulator